VLAVGSTENRIQLYTSPSASNPEFKKSLSLEGHTDWIRCLSFTTPIPTSASTDLSSFGYDIAPGEVLLASGGQDNYIRLWRFTRLSHTTSTSTKPAKSSNDNGLSALDELEKALAEKNPSPSASGTGKEGELRVKAHDFSIEGDGEFSCSSEAVLLGHDAWVTGLNWSPTSSSAANSSLRLLSASADRSLILWTPLQTSDLTTSATSTLWTSQHRFGEFSSVTNLGFFGALWGKDAATVLASGWGGSWHVWDHSSRDGEGEGEWEPRVATTGHLGKVSQVVWEPKGEYLLTASHDMSTRLHAPWRRRKGTSEEIETWHGELFHDLALI
jgi:elongator complex protein 2